MTLLQRQALRDLQGLPVVRRFEKILRNRRGGKRKVRVLWATRVELEQLAFLNTLATGRRPEGKFRFRGVVVEERT